MRGAEYTTKENLKRIHDNPKLRPHYQSTRGEDILVLLIALGWMLLLVWVLSW